MHFLTILKQSKILQFLQNTQFSMCLNTALLLGVACYYNWIIKNIILKQCFYTVSIRNYYQQYTFE